VILIEQFFAIQELEKALKEKGEFEKKLEELMDASLYQKYMFDQTEVWRCL